MTIHHPRVGFEILSINAGGTSDPNDATVFTINVGQTFLLPLPTVGWTQASGTPPGGIKLADGEIGHEIQIRGSSNNLDVRIYLPTGDSLYESSGFTTNFTIGT